ncbi:DUF350 domain-containing protein [Nocardia cyriacigeorgica]|uniref:DUF350 domain-containing protein n=1 Tax=Nocardia cyriacigeorgica TaxID=135487 RepID=A0A6P1D112_9NOCA|nr:DUF350 domain-containing protein [Nocardia cyriacigeorgica]NEW42263.1 DUF350 domain-containing protein [Nocardia cyriacigeorgica]NEW44176.1 DUF350 domain-containing protein [Nocardia cyriacigeorgica]NEW51326.1 DUF350 domain-containing protein [Nocardia cyriacigeorgica]NEW56901.1 DUF350 domain-containing protein [Nocardia cyriacigeorgica]
MLEDLPADAGAALAYSGVGIALMALGFAIVDILTPGNLRRQIWIERNRNASVLVSANLLGVGMIVATAIWTSQGAIVAALAASAVYGVIGLAAMALAFLLLDLVTPGEFRGVVTEKELHPGVWVTAALHIAVALVVAAGLT